MAHLNQPRYVPPQDSSAPSAPPERYGPPAQANAHPAYSQQASAEYGQQPAASYGQQMPAQYGQAGQPQAYGQQASAQYDQQAPAQYGQQVPAQYGPAGQPQAYGQPAQAYGAQPQGAQTVPGLTCRYCDASPAIKATVRGHRGMIIVMQFRSLKGPFCRDCGIAAVRDMSSQTLWQGWWGVGSMVVAPITLLVNLVQRVRLEGVAEPVRGYGSRPPIDKGKPLYLRPSIVGLLVPLFVLGFIMIGIVTSAAGS